jgi:excisionase family DNA binding protein
MTGRLQQTVRQVEIRPKWHTIAEVAEMLGYGLTKTKMLVLTGELRSLKDGRSRRILPEWVDSVLLTAHHPPTDHRYVATRGLGGAASEARRSCATLPRSSLPGGSCCTSWLYGRIKGRFPGRETAPDLRRDGGI